MRERGSELGFAIWGSILFLVVVAVLSFGTFGINKVLYPAQIAVQRDAVQESKSFVDSTNTTLGKLKMEHGRLQVKIAESDNPEVDATYKAQQNQVIEQMCTIMGTMDKATVDRSIASFISEEGGC